ncbi:MAG: hypothetical protein DJ555_02685 [Desulfurococcaceae archaeon]|nr:MAG: hypothetical protein DJ555_02685 [Desulfurococcaceae archaeon]
MDRERLLRLSLLLAIASIILIGVGAFIAVGAFTREPYIVSEKTLYRITRVSELNLTFVLEPNEIYEGEVIQPDSSIPIYLSLVRLLMVNYTYSLSQGVASGGMRVNVLLIHPDGWVKKYYETPINTDSRSVSKVFSLNLSDATELMIKLSKQVKAKQDMFTLRIVVDGDITISHQQYARRDSLSHALDLKVLVGYNKIEISGNQSMRSVFEEKSKSVETARLMGMSVDSARGVSLALTTGGVTLTLVSIVLRVNARKPERPEEILESRYSQAIVEVSSINMHSGNYRNIVYIEKPEELIKLSKILEKPVLKECYDTKKCDYYIMDQDTAFMLKTNGYEQKRTEHEQVRNRKQGQNDPE